jgi:hypothetical protein
MLGAYNRKPVGKAGKAKCVPAITRQISHTKHCFPGSDIPSGSIGPPRNCFQPEFFVPDFEETLVAAKFLERLSA